MQIVLRARRAGGGTRNDAASRPCDDTSAHASPDDRRPWSAHAVKCMTAACARASGYPPVTVMTPVIVGCTVQKYRYEPAAAKV